MSIVKENSSINSCKPFAASSILFLLISILTISAFIYFYVNSQQ